MPQRLVLIYPSSMHSPHIFALPELVFHIVSFLPAAQDRSHLSQCCSYMHELVLYEDIAIPLMSAPVIATQLTTRPDLARRCHTLWLKESRGMAPRSKSLLSPCSDLFSLLDILSKYGRLRSFRWYIDPRDFSSFYVPDSVCDSLRCASRGLETIDIHIPYDKDFRVSDLTKLETFTSEIESILGTFTVGINNVQGRFFKSSVFAPRA
jgi:hypothetical protein